MLKTEINTEEVRDDIQAAAYISISIGRAHFVTPHFEHGQWWVTCDCGAAWSVVDAEGGPAVYGFDFEQVSNGDEDYHNEEG